MSFKLNGNTLIPFSSMIFVAVFASWFLIFFSDVALNKSDIADIKIKIKKIDNIDSRLSNIEGKLDILIGRRR